MARDRLGRYELIRHLASGGMSQVYLARATGPGGFARHLIVKTLPVAQRDDETYLAMFLDEARLVATLHHQHIAQVFEVGNDDGAYFLAMEYVHGETLRQVLDTAKARGTRLPLELGLTVTCAAAAGLHHAHERCDADGTPLGIVHRDVSPSNLIAGYDGAIKLIDFGIAKATQRMTKTATGFIKGKAGYMAPEQARGYEVDRRADVWALGVLAYELTTQHRAFHAESQFETVQRTFHRDLQLPSEVVQGFPLALEHVIMTALELDPDDRFQDADAMRRALEEVTRELGLRTGATPVIGVLAELFPSRREPWLVAASQADERTPVLAEAEVSGDIVEPSAIELVDLTTQPFAKSASAVIEAAAGAAFEPAASALSRTLPPPIPLTARTRSASVTRPLAPARAQAAGSVPPRGLFGDTPTPSTPLPLAPPPFVSMSMSASLPIAAATSTSLPISRSLSIPMSAEPLPVIAPRTLAVGTTPPPLALPLFVGLGRRSVDAARPRRRRALTVGVIALVAAAVPIGLLLRSDDAPGRAPGSRGHAALATTAATTVTPTPAATRTSTPPAPPAAPAPSAAPAPPALPAVGPPPATGTVMLHVTTTPVGATVVLDGVRLGVTPFDAAVVTKPGTAWLKVRMRKHVAIKTAVSLEHDVQWDVALRPLRELAPVAP